MQQVQEGQNYEGSFRKTGSFDKGREGAKIVTKETRGISSSFESAKSKIAKRGAYFFANHTYFNF